MIGALQSKLTKTPKSLNQLEIEVYGHKLSSSLSKRIKSELLKTKGIRSTSTGIWVKFSKEQNPSIEQPKSQPSKYVKIGYDKTSSRLKFMHQRAKGLIKQGRTLNWTEALRLAAQEWNGDKGIYADNPSFPNLKTISNPQLLIDMTKNVIGTKGEITYLLDGKMLGIQNLADWRNFLTEFMVYSTKISSYHEKPNNFSIIGKGSDAKIVYR